MRALWIVPLAIALGALGSHLLFPGLQKPPQVAAQPIAVVTSWGRSGVEAWLLYALTMAVAGTGYLFVLAAARRGEIDRRAIVAATLASALAAVGFRFTFSSDVYAYAAYGALAATHHDPYVHQTFPPLQLVDATWTHAIGFEWPSLPACIYGAGFVELARAIVVATHFNLAHTLLVLRLLEIAAFAGIVALAPNALVAATVGLNPVVISTVGDGHNDALVLLAITLAYLLAKIRGGAGGALAGFSTLLKATGGIAALALAYALRSRRFAWSAVVGLVVSVAVQALANERWGGTQPFAVTDFVGTPQAALALALRGLAALVFLGAALYAARRNERARSLATAALAVWALYPNDYPWYGMWLLPLAAFTLDYREGRALIALTFSSTLRYLSDVYGLAPAAPWLELIVVTIPLCFFAWRPPFSEKMQPA